MDDIKLETSDFNSYFNILKMVLARLDESGMGLNLCKMLKHRTEKIYVKQMHVEAEHVDDLLSIDVFGPLPLKPGGVIALFVALE